MYRACRCTAACSSLWLCDSRDAWLYHADADSPLPPLSPENMSLVLIIPERLPEYDVILNAPCTQRRQSRRRGRACRASRAGSFKFADKLTSRGLIRVVGAKTQANACKPHRPSSQVSLPSGPLSVRTRSARPYRGWYKTKSSDTETVVNFTQLPGISSEFSLSFHLATVSRGRSRGANGSGGHEAAPAPSAAAVGVE